MTVEKAFEENKIGEFRNSEERLLEDEEKEENTEKAVENLEGFYELRGGDRNDEIVKKWEEEYLEDPNLFFSEESIENLHDIPASERLLMFARACGSLQISTDIVENYYQIFPEDLEAVKMLFFDCGGHPDRGFEFNLFSVSAESMVKSSPNLLKEFRSIRQYLEMSERRKYAPDFILDGTKGSYAGEFERFGSAADGFAKALDEAEELNFKGDHFINPQQIFTPEYDLLSEDQKAEFLRGCVNTLHFNLLFHETYNSCFTKDLEDRAGVRMRAASTSGYRFGDVAHSMIYKTYQPLSAYNAPQKGFEYIMDSCCESGGMLEEYPYHRLLLSVIDKLGNSESQNDENIDKLVDFWNKNRNPIFGNAVAEAISKQGPEKAASQLLKLLREEKEDRNALTAMLYRIEFGKIGISEEGVRYLEKIYDLEELNDPNYHVSRLTPDGELGIFDENKKLIKYFCLNPDDLVSDEKVIKAVVLDFVYENLFFPKENETFEERAKREKYLEEFKQHYYEITEQEFFKNQDNLKLNNLSLREQGWFLVYYNEASNENRDRLQEFVQKFGEDGIKTFLAMESQEEVGDKILDMSERMRPEVAQYVFYKFNEILRGLKKSKDEFSEMLKGDKKISQQELERIHQNLLKKGASMLADFDFDKDLESEIGLMKKLNDYNSDLILTASVFKGMEKGSVDLEDIKDISLEVLESKKTFGNCDDLKGIMVQEFWDKDMKDISADAMREIGERFSSKKDKDMVNMLADMLEIYAKNYAERPKFGQKLIRGFLLSLMGDDSQDKLYLLRKEGNIMAFCKFSPIGDKQEYVSALNVQDALKDLAIGTSFSNECLKREFENSDIVAHCDAFTPTSSMHIEKGGFAVRKVIDDFDESEEGVSSFEIKKEMQSGYVATLLSQDNIKVLYEDRFKNNIYNDGDDMIIVKYPSDSNALYGVGKKLVNESGYAMTRFFYSGKDNEDCYCVFEKEES